MAGREKKPNPELIAWLTERIAESGRAVTHLSIAAGKSKGWLSGVTNRGSEAEPEALAAFCRAIGVSPLRGFQAAGWLTAEDVGDVSVPDLVVSDDEREFIALFREAGPSAQRMTLAGLREERAARQETGAESSDLADPRAPRVQGRA